MEGFKILQGEQIAANEPSQNRYVQQTRGQLGEAARKIGQTGASVASALAGLPGDIAGGALGLTKYATSGATPSYGEVQEKLPISLPTSEQVRGGINRATGGYTEAQTPGEQTWDNIVQTATNLLVPFPTPGKLKAAPGIVKGAIKGLTRESAVKGLKTAGRAAAIAGVGEGAKELAHSLGAEEGGQALAKLGTMGVASLFGGRRALAKKMGEGYDLSEAAAAGKETGSQVLIDNIKKIEKELPKSHPGLGFIKDRIKEVKGLIESESGLVDAAGKPISKGQIPVSDLIKLKRGLNKWWNEKDALSSHDLLGELIGAVKKPIDAFAHDNAQFGKYWNPSEDIFKGLKAQSEVTKNLKKYVNFSNLKNAGAQAAIAALGGYFGHIPGAIAPLSVAFGAREASQFADFILKSKSARKYYTDMLKYASKGSAAGIGRSVKGLDNIATKEGFSFEPTGFNIISGGKVK